MFLTLLYLSHKREILEKDHQIRIVEIYFIEIIYALARYIEKIKNNNQSESESNKQEFSETSAKTEDNKEII